MKKYILLVLASFLFSCNKQKQQPIKTGLEGKALPAFNIRLNDSLTVFNTGSISKNNPFVLFYYSPHCPYCRAMLRDIIDESDKLKDITFYMITDFPFSDMKQFDKEFNISHYSNIIDGFDIDNSVIRYYKPQAVPYLAIYGKDKRLNGAYEGQVGVNEILELLHK